MADKMPPASFSPDDSQVVGSFEAGLVDFPGCPLCQHGARPIAIQCWRCSLIFHIHREAMGHVPVGANFAIYCVDPLCRAENVLLKHAVEGIVNPTDYQESQREAWWGYVRGVTRRIP